NLYRRVNGPGCPGLPSSNAIFRPGGKAGGPSVHFISSGVSITMPAGIDDMPGIDGAWAEAVVTIAKARRMKNVSRRSIEHLRGNVGGVYSTLGSRMTPWDPSQYLKFAGQRLRPAVDLLNRIDVEDPAEVYDLGAGAGNVTQLLRTRWPNARITGIDES